MTTAPAPRRTRRSAALVAGALSALALSGCSLNSPTTTLLQYAPADGVQVDGEGLAVRDLVVVSHAGGAPAALSGSLVNQTDEPMEVTVSVNGEELSPTVQVAAHGRARLDGTAADGSAGEGLVLPALESPAGQGAEVRFSAAGQSVSAIAPVVLPHGPYEDFADQAGGTVAPHPAEEGDDH